MRALNEPVIRVPEVAASRWYGPSPDSLCPCGSRRRSSNCHKAKDGSWVALTPPPLLTGPRTGYTHPKCYAGSSGDCDRQLTREHFITDDILGHISHDGNAVSVEGATWQKTGEQRMTIGRASLARKMLCQRHNHALSPLDRMAGEFFRYAIEDHLDIFPYLIGGYDTTFRRSFTLVSGPYFELWLLKVVWGALEAAALEIDGRTAYRFRLGVTRPQLTEILWRGAPWPATWGFYVLYNQDSERPSVPRSVRIRLANVGSEVLGGFVAAAGFEYLLSFETPTVPRTYRPGALSLSRVGYERDSYKMIAFAWPELGHPFLPATSQVPPGGDLSLPPTPRAASLVGQSEPGVFTVRPITGQG